MFTPATFIDGSAGNTPITAATLNNLEQGIVAADITNPASAAAVALAAGYVGAVVETILVVKPDGTGAFLSPKAANDSILDAGPLKRYVILIYPGLYQDTNDWIPQPYTVLRGIHRDSCVLAFANAVNALDPAVTNNSTITITATTSLENLTISIEGGRYAVHSEQSGVNRDALHSVRNCRFIHKGYAAVNAWRAANPASGLAQFVSSQAAWGFGSASGLIETFQDCTFDSPYGPFYGHNNQSFTKPTQSQFIGARFTSQSITAGGVTINSLGSGQSDGYRFTSCQFDTLWVYHTDTSWMVPTYADHLDFDIVLDRCNPVGYMDDSRGQALSIISTFGSAGVLSTVRLSGTAVPVLIGTVTYRDGTGDTGFGGDGYGNLDMSGILLGFSAIAGNNTLGTRLGNCTATPITLTALNQGFVSSTMTFNTDYTAMSNSAILSAINTALGGNGFVASLVNPASYRYPRVIGSETSLVNSGAGIAQYTAVAFAAGGRQIRPMATGDAAALFAGIALERIPANGYGRILREGVMNKSQLAGLASATVAAGTVLYQSDTTAGQFATTGTRVALTGRATDWAYFKSTA